MPQNFTIDDTDATLVYGPGWGVASPNDPALDNYFENTYHATQTSGMNVSLSFSGVAIYLFGSKGPDRGNFTIRYDNLIQSLSSHADTLSYRQLLFSIQLPAGDHSVTLTYTDDSQSWFDLDFVTVTGTANSTSTPSGASSTISPPPVVPTTTDSGSSSSLLPSGVITAPATSLHTSNNVTFILSVTFGILLLSLAGFVAGYLIRRRRRRLHRKAAYSTHYLTSDENPQSVRSAGSAFLTPQSISPPSKMSTPFAALPPGPNPASLSPSANNITNTHPPEPATSDVEMRQWGHSSPGRSVPAARPWSPFTTPINRIFGATKEGADSMKSTFLKV